VCIRTPPRLFKSMRELVNGPLVAFEVGLQVEARFAVLFGAFESANVLAMRVFTVQN
jgi:hypothetical protein